MSLGIALSGPPAEVDSSKIVNGSEPLEGLILTLNLLDAWDGRGVASGSREDGWLAEPFDGVVIIL